MPTGYIRAIGINYAGTLPKIKKSQEQLQPVFEAFTNSLESIRLSGKEMKEGTITIKLNFQNNLFSKEKREFDFESIAIEDSGIGFNDREFLRFENLNDTSKAFFNKGSGRVQFLHFFERTEYVSVFEDDSSPTGFRERSFTLSKSDGFLRENAIIRVDGEKEIKTDKPTTTLTFKSPLSEKDEEYYKALTVDELKEKLIAHYLVYFCENRSSLPIIKLQYLINKNVEVERDISESDIPRFDKQEDINVSYSRFLSDGKTIERIGKYETLNLKAFKIHKDQLKKNGLKLASKGEIAKDIRLENLLVDDYIEDNRYLFLLSGDYINQKDSDTRGKLTIPNLEEFKKTHGDSDNLFSEEEILLDDIQDVANSKILSMYEEIRNRIKEQDLEITKLKEMFWLSEESIKEAKIKLNDSDERILEKVYQADAKLIAQKDAEIKKRVDALEHLNPASDDFETTFQKEVEELAKAIPLQNRNSLTHYIARRKLVLELFNKILDKQLEIQKSTHRKLDEKLIHNLLFQQSSSNPESSDLWIINEDFIYFNGVSNQRLRDVTIDGNSLFKQEFSDEEDKYLKSMGENRTIKIPDILLFPEESKCIIIELKDPDVNASEHLTQMDYYAYLIRNYTTDAFPITTFYGYLLGENIDYRDVRGRVSAYEHSYHFNYIFRPATKVVGENGRTDGSIYNEVITYRSLIQRAINRNKIFMQKLQA